MFAVVALLVLVSVAVLMLVLAPPRCLLRRASQTTGVVYCLSTSQPLIALTIDDGPDPETTPLILEVLARRGARATFFVLGERSEQHRECLQQIVDAGHELGHHGWRDEKAIRLSAAAFADDFERTRAALAPSNTRWYRPGGGFFNRAMQRYVQQQQHQLVLGSIYPHDAHLAWSAFSKWFLLWRVRPGDIVVLHDGQGRGARTAAVLEQVLPHWKQRGWKVVTLGELADAAAAQ